MTTTTEPHVTLQQPVVVTSSKVNASAQVLKVAPGDQSKKPVGMGKGNKLLNKGKKGAVKPSNSGVVASTKNRAKVTAASIQELTEEMQAIEQESFNDEHVSKVTQESDLEQEDSENCLTEDEGQ